jgi:FkbM family methyltransferase
MIPKIMHFTLPKQASAKQMAAIETARRLHPAWEVRVWQDPVDTTGFRLAHYHSKCASGAQLADLIRLDVVLIHGGIYIDSDVDIIRPFDALIARENFFCSEDGKYITNAVFAAVPGSALIETLVSELEQHEPDWIQPPNETTGPFLFARVLHWRKDLEVLPRETFFPYMAHEAPSEPLPTTFAVHRWAGSWLKDRPQIPPRPLENRPAGTIRSLVKGMLSPLVSKVEDRLAKAIVEKHQRPALAYSIGSDLVAQTTRGITMSLPGRDLSITPEIALRGTYEETELRFLERTLHGGDFFVDVGCNIGVFSLVAARKVGRFGRVLAFDPNPIVLDHLRRSAVINWFHDRIVVHQCALGGDAREITLEFSDLRLGDGNLGAEVGSVFHRSIDFIGQSHRVLADQIRLDSAVPTDVEIKIVKIDVEGYEHSVLSGATRLLEQRQAMFFMMEILEEVSAGQHGLNMRAAQRIVDAGYIPGTSSADGTFVGAASLESAIRKSRNVIFARAS